MRFFSAKRLGLWMVSQGIRLPEGPANRYQEFSYLKRLLKRLSINCVIDVGANTGQFAAELRGAGYDGFIYSFEPVASAFSELEETFSGDPRWRGLQVALGRENTTMTINVIPSCTVMSSLLTPRGDWPNIEQETIPVRRLDDLFSDIVGPIPEPRVFLKLDTQGYDLQVFEGARGCRGQIDVLQSELSVVPLYDGMPTYLEALSTFQKAGFVLTNLSVVSRAPEGQLLELNGLMRRNSVGIP
jgi:FkbM family methyltransferase